MTAKADNPSAPESGAVSATRSARMAGLILWCLILAYALFFSAHSLQRHATFNTYAADLSFIDQPMWNTLQGRFLERTLDERQVTRLAEHFEPIIIPVALVFYLWDDVRAILIVQTLVLALGALPVYWIARAQLGNPWLALAFAGVYLMFPALQAANLADFHADPFVVTPLLFAFWYATQARYAPMWAWALVAMLSKENLPTLTFMLGLYVLLSKEQVTQEAYRPDLPLVPPPGSPFSQSLLTRRRLHGLALMAVSLAWFYVATFLIVDPLARQVYGSQGPIYLASRYAEFGGGLTGLFRALISQPLDVLGLLRQPERLGYLAGLLASVGWLALLAPELLLLGLPVLIANTLSNFPGQYSGEQHYSAPLVPIFIIAAIYGFRRLRTVLGRTGSDSSPPKGSRFTFSSLLILAWLLAWSLGYHHLRGWTPLARGFEWPRLTAHHRLLARFVAQIPDDAALSTTPPLHPHLAHREKIYVFPTVADADYVLLDISGRTDAHPNDVRAAFDSLIESGRFTLVDAADGYVLLQRGPGAGGNGPILPDAFFDFARAPGAQPQYPTMVEFDGRLRLVGYDVVDDPKWRQTYLRLYWQALAPLPEDLWLWPFVFGEDGALIEDASQRPMVAPLWYPPSQWRPGEIVVTDMLPWDLGSRFQVGLAVLQGSPGEGDPAVAFHDPARRLPVSAAGPGIALFHADTWAQLGAFVRNGRSLAPAQAGPSLLPIDVSFAEGVRLTGYQISDAPSHLSAVLRWEPAAPIPGDYTVFVHLVAPDGTVVAQSDAQPGWVVSWPTSRWQPGQSVPDGHRLSIPPELPPGRYQVRAGLYDWRTLDRLLVIDALGQPVGDYAVLGELEMGR